MNQVLRVIDLKVSNLKIYCQLKAFKLTFIQSKILGKFLSKDFQNNLNRLLNLVSKKLV